VQLVPGEQFGQYVVEAELGRGGQAVVYRARQTTTHRDVALKVFDELEDAGKLARFRREAIAAARVDDPRIVTVFESGDVEGVPFIAMRLVPGPSLGELVARAGPLPPARALAILEDVASAVDAAHQHGLVHRDIKPANVLLDLDDRAYLSDFGVARLEDLPGLTRRGDWLGTVEYVSPEQADGHPATAASDIYAFGVLAYEVLCGRPPFVHRQASAVLVAHVRDVPPPVRSINPLLPERIDTALAPALAKAPADRPAQARDVVESLRDALIGGTDLAPGEGHTQVAAPSSTRVINRRRSEDPTRVPGAEDLTRIGGAEALTQVAPVTGTVVMAAPAPPQRGRARRVAVVLACAALIAAGAAGGWAFGHRTATTARADGYRSGYAAGVATGERVPDASPGQYRVVEVSPSGHSKYVGKAFNSGDCVRVNGNGSVDNISGSLFSPCGLFSGL
jgi:serine/threonine-protein kinase